MSQQATEPDPRDLKMRIKWIYGEPDHPPMTGEKITSLRNVATHRIQGKRFSGKSALGENIFFRYVKNGATGYDLYAAKDNESLAALMGPFKDYVWLIHGDDVKLQCGYNTIKASELDPVTSPGERVYITSRRFYKNEADKFQALLRFTELAQQRDDWNRVDVIFIREAQQYISSQTKTRQVHTKKEAIDSFVDFHEEAVHSGFAVIMDAQRQMEVSKSVRELTTYLYFKNIGRMEIPSDIHWIYSENTVNFDLDALRHLDPDEFLVLTDANSIGLGRFEMPSWHVHRGAGLMGSLGIVPIEKGSGKELVFEAPGSEAPSESVPGRAGTKSDKRRVVTDEQMVVITQMFERGAGPLEIYQQLLAKHNYTGSRPTIDNKLEVLRAKKKASGSQ